MLEAMLGAYYFQFLIQLAQTLEYFVPVIFFAWPLKRRRRFALRFLLSLLPMAALTAASVVMRTVDSGYLSRFLFATLRYGETLPFLALCYDEANYTKIRVWCAATAATEISADVYALVFTAFGVDVTASIKLVPAWPDNQLRDWLIYASAHILIVFAVYLLVGRKVRREHDSRARVTLFALSAASILVLSNLNTALGLFQGEGTHLMVTCRACKILLSIVILLMHTLITVQSNYRAEISLMEQVMAEERKQYAQSKENIDLINMRVHDLKHQLEHFSGRLTDQEIASLKDAVSIYDKSIRTGSDVLDTVLFQNHLACEAENISLSCMADGGALSFMRTRHVYALFSNAIGNAMEAVRKLEDPEKKFIDIAVAKRNGRVEISVANYYEGSLRLRDGLPETSKPDRNQHGFGTMSMKYIAEQYGGTMQILTDSDTYTLQISIPVPAETAKTAAG